MFKRWWTEAECLFYKLFRRYYVASKCGHKTKLMAKVNIFGENFIFTYKIGKIEYCTGCIAEMAIRCAWCGKSIVIGDPVTLNTPTKNFKIPDYAVRYGKASHIQLVGCLRWECADSGADRAGFWEIPGKVYRVLSPMEMVIATEDCIIVNDVNDPSEAIPYPKKNGEKPSLN